MKKYTIVTALFLALLFSGCSDKPQVDATSGSNGSSVSADSDVDRIKAGSEVTPGGETLSGSAMMDALEAKMQNVYFDFDKFNIRADQVSRVDNNAQIAKSEEAAQYTIKIEGNTDEWGTDEYNYALGLKRAKSVKDALTDRGVDAQKTVLVSYGESNPVCTQSNRDCWQQNRRVEIKVLP
jgi:peptidoglycan-associated lipoprotein